MALLFKPFIIALAITSMSCCTTNMNAEPPRDALRTTADPEDLGAKHGEWKNCSGEIGSHACNFEMFDQYSNKFELYDYYGSIIILDFSTMWCAACQHAAQKAQGVHDAYKGLGVIWVTILLQDLNGNPVTETGAIQWATAFNITDSPVLVGDVDIADPNQRGSFRINLLPTFVIIDRDMSVHYYMDGWNNKRLLDQVDALIANEKP